MDKKCILKQMGSNRSRSGIAFLLYPLLAVMIWALRVSESASQIGCVTHGCRVSHTSANEQTAATRAVPVSVCHSTDSITLPTVERRMIGNTYCSSNSDTLSLLSLCVCVYSVCLLLLLSVFLLGCGLVSL